MRSLQFRAGICDYNKKWRCHKHTQKYEWMISTRALHEITTITLKVTETETSLTRRHVNPLKIWTTDKNLSVTLSDKNGLWMIVPQLKMEISVYENIEGHDINNQTQKIQPTKNYFFKWRRILVKIHRISSNDA